MRCIRTCGVGDHDCLGVLVREIEPIAEEKGADERQVFEFLERDGRFKQLPFGLKREELVNELFGVRQEVVIIVLVPIHRNRK